jgi:hypothetical protein
MSSMSIDPQKLSIDLLTIYVDRSTLNKGKTCVSSVSIDPQKKSIDQHYSAHGSNITRTPIVRIYYKIYLNLRPSRWIRSFLDDLGHPNHYKTEPTPHVQFTLQFSPKSLSVSLPISLKFCLCLCLCLSLSLSLSRVSPPKKKKKLGGSLL